MPKFFITSDLHSFYEPFIEALDAAGFDASNEEHWLIVCGDCFDRGPDSCKLYDFLMALERKVLIKGNHDILMQDLLDCGYISSHDCRNGTDKTFWQLLNKEPPAFAEDSYKAVSKILQPFWDQQVNYFETANYIFVHSWIPTNVSYDNTASKPWHRVGKTYSYKEDWRQAADFEWEEATWGNPFELAKNGLNQTGKTIVFGHWHTSWPRAKYEGKSEFDEGADFSPYFGDGYIALDACTSHTNKVNVIVLQDDKIKKHKAAEFEQLELDFLKEIKS